MKGQAFSSDASRDLPQKAPHPIALNLLGMVIAALKFRGRVWQRRRVYVVINKVPDLDSFGNGTVVVNSGLFAILENESQLAFLLEQAVAEIVEKEDWR